MDIIKCGKVVVPKGTAITVPLDGIRISKKTDQYVERGDWEGLAKLAQGDTRIALDIEGMATHLPGFSIENYTLSSPNFPPLTIYRNSFTVEIKTQLFDLLEPNMGCVIWAACTEFIR